MGDDPVDYVDPTGETRRISKLFVRLATEQRPELFIFTDRKERILAMLDGHVTYERFQDVLKQAPTDPDRLIWNIGHGGPREIANVDRNAFNIELAAARKDRNLGIGLRHGPRVVLRSRFVLRDLVKRVTLRVKHKVGDGGAMGYFVVPRRTKIPSRPHPLWKDFPHLNRTRFSKRVVDMQERLFRRINNWGHVFDEYNEGWIAVEYHYGDAGWIADLTQVWVDFRKGLNFTTVTKELEKFTIIDQEYEAPWDPWTTYERNYEP
jgi:hypothetical protein